MTRTAPGCTVRSAAPGPALALGAVTGLARAAFDYCGPMLKIRRRDKPCDEANKAQPPQRRPCLPSTFTVLACGPLWPISSKNVTRVPGANRPALPSRTLFW
jgi:hypothetical protein